MQLVHTFVRLALVVSLATGCSFRPYLRESLAKPVTSAAPCYTGDICPITFDGLELMWADRR